ncbi:MAG: apolipoprotein N-acyltransferase [Proteobacteria bacterium]|nr:apolipoprotein N-acyltransferase [Pseudomonadota bacterium]
MNTEGKLAAPLSLCAGAATVFAFAPFGFALVAPAMLGGQFLFWQHAHSPRTAAKLGFAYGVGLFGAGVSWVYVPLQTFGGMPAALAVLATATWVAYLALWPALVGALAVRFTEHDSVPRALALATLWTLSEWLRGRGYTGFPWLLVGSAQLPGSSLAGFAPLGGVFGVSLATALAAALLALFVEAITQHARRLMFASLAGIALLFAAGWGLQHLTWTERVGEPLTISLIQGNVAQHQKFDPAYRDRNFLLYAHLAEVSRGRLIVLPESAFPVFADEVPAEILDRIAAAAAARNGDALVGLFTVVESPIPGDEPAIHNSVITVGAGKPQLYRKHHLVPFGESIPLKSVVGGFIEHVLAIPLADQAAGPADAPPLDVAGQRVAVNICYEDAFGNELRRRVRDATLLVNVTNDAWYGRSIAADQHDQIAAMRALETGRPLLRATNTGITTAVGADGREAARLPWFTRGILEVTVSGRRGVTPYMAIGDTGPVVLAVALLALALVVARRNRTGGTGRLAGETR